jgi:hypothetical protein
MAPYICGNFQINSAANAGENKECHSEQVEESIQEKRRRNASLPRRLGGNSFSRPPAGSFSYAVIFHTIRT